MRRPCSKPKIIAIEKLKKETKLSEKDIKKIINNVCKWRKKMFGE